MEPIRTYSAPLDGLRAVAILAVIVFHFAGGLLPGGFIGVDIFFVISGYIITRNILSDKLEGVFRLEVFYKKRFLRLFPALLLVVLAAVFFSTLYVSDLRVQLFAQVGTYAVASVSNVYFFLNSGYFEDTSKTNILLHTWSLSVEEQFYIIWPLACGIIFVLRKKIFQTLVLAFVLALAVSVVIYWYSSSAMFYLMPARAFQFVAGAFIAVVHLRYGESLERQGRLSRSNLALAFWLGAAGIISSLVLADGQSYNFLIAALLPTIGSSLVILSINGSAPQALLAQPFMIWVGRRAYTLYLVHWPISVLMLYEMGTGRDLQFYLVAVALVVFLSEIVHRFVERPFVSKNADRPPAEALKIYLAVIMMAGGLIALAHLWAGSTPESSEAQNPPSPSLLSSVDETSTSAATEASAALLAITEEYRSAAHRAGLYWVEWNGMSETGFGCYLNREMRVRDFPWDDCSAEARGSNVLVLGDSTGREALLAIHTATDDDQIGMISAPGCLPILPGPPRHSSNQCREFNARRLEILESSEFEVVVLAGNWRRSSARELSETIDFLLERGMKVVVFGLRPVFFESVPNLLDSPDGAEVSADLTRFILWDSNETFVELAESYGNNPRVTILDSRGGLCRIGCGAFSEAGELLYLDDVHLSPAAAAHLGRHHSGDLLLALGQ